MKKYQKILATTAAVAMSAALCFSLAACGETKPANLVGSYNSCGYTFMTAFPGYTFKQLTSNVQSLNVYDDNTYVLAQTTKALSGDLSFDPGNTGDSNAVTNDRGCTITYYYGTYTVTEEEGMMTYKLSAPNRVVYSATASATASQAVYYDTANWTTAMTGEGENAQTAEDYLKSMAYAELTCTVDGATYGFDYLDVSAAK